MKERVFAAIFSGVFLGIGAALFQLLGIWKVKPKTEEVMFAMSEPYYLYIAISSFILSFVLGSNITWAFWNMIFRTRRR